MQKKHDRDKKDIFVYRQYVSDREKKNGQKERDADRLRQISDRERDTEKERQRQRKGDRGRETERGRQRKGDIEKETEKFLNLSIHVFRKPYTSPNYRRKPKRGRLEQCPLNPNIIKRGGLFHPKLYKNYTTLWDIMLKL